jgi:hypothetical protein
MQTSGIYKLEFLDKFYYIGQSVNLGKRDKDHFIALKAGTHFNYKVQTKYDNLGILPIYYIEKLCKPSELNSYESSLIDLKNPLCLNIKAGGNSNFGFNTPTSKYYTDDIETAFFILIDSPGIPHKEVADFVGINISAIHDISAGRGRVFTELSTKYPEKYAQLLKMKAHNTRGKTTIVLQHDTGSIVTLVTGGYSKFCIDNNVQMGNLSKVLNGTRKHTMGWKLIDKYDN